MLIGNNFHLMETIYSMVIIWLILAIVISIFSFSLNTGIAAALLITIYMFPAYFAHSRGHRNSDSIATFNLFLGWTFIGWIAALIWAQNDFDRSRLKETPYSIAKPYLKKVKNSKNVKRVLSYLKNKIKTIFKG